MKPVINIETGQPIRNDIFLAPLTPSDLDYIKAQALDLLNRVPMVVKVVTDGLVNWIFGNILCLARCFDDKGASLIHPYCSNSR